MAEKPCLKRHFCFYDEDVQGAGIFFLLPLSRHLPWRDPIGHSWCAQETERHKGTLFSIFPGFEIQEQAGPGVTRAASFAQSLQPSNSSVHPSKHPSIHQSIRQTIAGTHSCPISYSATCNITSSCKSEGPDLDESANQKNVTSEPCAQARGLILPYQPHARSEAHAQGRGMEWNGMEYFC